MGRPARFCHLVASTRTATVHSLAVARAFGWGRWTLAELEPERRLVLRVPASPVAAVLRAGEGTTDVSRDWFASGVAEAIGRLVLGMAWSDDHDVPVERVLDRVHDRDELVTEVSTCITAGADATTIVVQTAAARRVRACTVFGSRDANGGRAQDGGADHRALNRAPRRASNGEPLRPGHARVRPCHHFEPARLSRSSSQGSRCR